MRCNWCHSYRWFLRVDRHNCCHLLTIRKTSSMEVRWSQNRVMSIVFSAGSNSVRSPRKRRCTSIRSISTWRQLLTICEEVSSVVMIIKSINVTPFRSIISSAVTSSFFSFFRRPISLWKSLGCLGNFIFKAWMLTQVEKVPFNEH